MNNHMLSMPRNLAQHFHIRSDDGSDVYVRSMEGLARITGTDNEIGRMHLEADIEYINHVVKPDRHLANKALFTYTGDMHVEIPEGAELIQGPSPYWRCCRRNKQGDWRIRSEESHEILHYADTYAGIIRFDWLDRTPHVYHVGDIYLYKGTAIFVPQDASIEPIRPNRVVSVINSVSSTIDVNPKNKLPLFEKVGAR